MKLKGRFKEANISSTNKSLKGHALLWLTELLRILEDQLRKTFYKNISFKTSIFLKEQKF